MIFNMLNDLYQATSEYVYYGSMTHMTKNVSTQTGQFSEYISFVMLPPADRLDVVGKGINETHNTGGFFKHLIFANQSYCRHFKDAFTYSMISLKASMCFLVHAFWPDVFTQTGSEIIIDLGNVIFEKYNKRMSELSSSE